MGTTLVSRFGCDMYACIPTYIYRCAHIMIIINIMIIMINMHNNIYIYVYLGVCILVHIVYMFVNVFN
jgi:hypothetical protein